MHNFVVRGLSFVGATAMFSVVCMAPCAEDIQPLATAATTAAQAPVPQARVSPLPRSHTRILMVLGLTTRINSVLIRSGK